MHAREAVLLLPLLALSATGCLESEIRHDIYLEPDGAAVWSVLQTDVVSNEKDPAERDREEREFRKRLLGEDPPIAEALRALGGWKVDTVVIRDERPFALAVKARFPRVDRMLEGYFDRVHPEAGAFSYLGGRCAGGIPLPVTRYVANVPSQCPPS